MASLYTLYQTFFWATLYVKSIVINCLSIIFQKNSNTLDFVENTENTQKQLFVRLFSE